MIPELGHYALILALCFSLVQCIFPMIGTLQQRTVWIRMARPAALGQCIFVALGFFSLSYAFITNDFTVAYVAENSSSELPIIYRFCALWGAHEGSLLLWVFLLGGWTLAVAKFSRQLPLETVARVLAVMGFISTGFLLFLLTTSNPFARIFSNIPQNGQDLNPLLQDPGLAIHPPMLYMGYVGFSVAFAFAMSALIGKRLDAAWARWSKPWTLVAWSFLTFGITLGSWWAYRELGWGGWWFWDPVENASFLPWLVGTALIHSLAVSDKRDAFKAWTVLLAIFTFSLSLLGTFLVRSGVLISVHSFAVDPRRGLFMLIFLLIVIGSSLALYAFRMQKVRNSIYFAPLSRESLLLANNLLLTGAMLTILLGTLYPLMLDTLGLEKISVGPPYFNIVFIPFMLCILFLMGIAPISRWHDTPLQLVVKKLWLILILSMLLGVALPLIITQSLSVGVAAGISLAIWIVVTTLQSTFKRTKYFFTVKKLSRSQWGMVIAHVGVAVCALGVVLTSHYSIQKEVRLSPQESVIVGNYQFRFLGVRDIQGANYTGVEGGVLVSKNNIIITLLRPQQRVYTVRKTAMSETAIDMSLFRDLYVALGEPLEKDAWSFRIYYKPFVRWIWMGGLLMILGGILSLLDKRYRIIRRQEMKI